MCFHLSLVSILCTWLSAHGYEKNFFCKRCSPFVIFLSACWWYTSLKVHMYNSIYMHYAAKIRSRHWIHKFQLSGCKSVMWQEGTPHNLSSYLVSAINILMIGWRTCSTFRSCVLFVVVFVVCRNAHILKQNPKINLDKALEVMMLFIRGA